jgi:hypothetical protein
MGLVFIFSCKNSKPGMMPEISHADSAAVLYYKTPGNPRFYSYAKVKDLKQFEQVVKDVNDEVIKNIDDCVTDGKIYFYKGTEEVYTIYFSMAEGCKTLSFIKTGEKYFTGMSKEAVELLSELQKEAKEPTAAN